ncbi:unnamed protein product [Lepidochelys olivacea]
MKSTSLTQFRPILASFLFCSFLRALISTYPCKLIGILPKQEVMKRTLRGLKEKNRKKPQKLRNGASIQADVHR